MKAKLLALLLLLPFLTPLSGCKSIDKAGVYQGDQLLYNADLVIATSFDVVHSFVKWELENRGALGQAPQATQYADSLRAQYPTWHRAALAARTAYVGDPSATNRTALQQALDVLREATHQANQWFANTQRLAPSLR